MADEVLQKTPEQGAGQSINFNYLRSLIDPPPLKEDKEDEKPEEKPSINFDYLRSLTNTPSKQVESPLIEREFELPFGPDTKRSGWASPMYEDELKKSFGLEFSGSKKNKKNIVEGVPFMFTEKDKDFIPKKFPHPSQRTVSGMSPEDQEKVWLRLNPEGREEYSKKNPRKFINILGREEDKEPSEISQLAAAEVKGARLAARKPYTPPEEWEGKRGSLAKWAFGLADSNPKKFGKRDHWERHGIIGGLMPDTALLALAGYDEVVDKTFKELRSAGISGAAGYKGYKYGTPLGAKGKLVGGFIGASLGKSFGDALAGELATAGEQIEYGMYGTLPVDKVTGAMAKSFFRRFLARGAEGFTVNEAALQAQSILDEGKELPLDPQSIISRNFAMFFMNGGLGAIHSSSKTKPDNVSPLDNQSEAINAFAADTLRLEKKRINKKIQSLKTEIKSDKGRSGAKAAQDRKSKLGSLDTELNYINSKLIRSDKGESLITGINDELRLSQVLARAVRNKNIVGNLDGLLELSKPAIVIKKGAAQIPEGVSGRSELMQKTMPDAPPPAATPEEGGFMNSYDRARHKLISEHQAITSMHRIAKKAGLTEDPNRSDLGLDFDLLHTARGRGDAKVLMHDQHVTNKAAKEDLLQPFDDYLFLKRVEARLADDNARNASLKEIEDLLSSINKEYAGTPPKEVKEYVKELNKVKKGLEERKDRKRVAAIRGEDGEIIYWNPEMVSKELGLLKERLGNDKWLSVEKLGESFQQSSKKMLKDLEKGGIISKEQRLDIESRNQFYAPFEVEKYLQAPKDGAGGGRSPIQAIVGIDDPLATIASPNESFRNKLISSTLSIEHNLAKLEFVNQLEKAIGNDSFLRKLNKVDGAFKELPPDSSEGVFTVIRNGETEKYAVDKTVAKAIESFGGNMNELRNTRLGKLLHYTAKPFKVGTTKWSAPFQIINALVSDLPTNALTSDYGLKANPVDWARFIGDYANSFVLALKGQSKNPPKEYIDLLENGFLGNTWSQALDPTYDAVRRLPRADGRLVGTTGSKIMQVGERAAGYIDILPDAIEQMGKLVPIKRAGRHHDVKDWKSFAKKNPDIARQIRTEITQQSGSPQFSRIGEAGKTLDLIFMFYNARMQGAARDVARLSGQAGGLSGNAGKKAWGRLSLAVGLPTVYLTHRNLNEYGEDYAKVPDRIKDHNWIFFKDNYIKDEDGANLMRDYWTLPKRDIIKALANTAEGIVTHMITEDPDVSPADLAFGLTKKAVGDTSPIEFNPAGESTWLQTIASQLNPLGKYGIETLQKTPEGQVRDLWMGRNLVPSSRLGGDKPEKQYKESTEKGYIAVGEALGVSPIEVKRAVNAFTGNLIGQFVPDREVVGREAPLDEFGRKKPPPSTIGEVVGQIPQDIANNPIFKFLGQRFIAPNFVQDTKASQWLKELQTKERNKQIEADEKANEWVDRKIRGKDVPIRGNKSRVLSQAINDLLFYDFPDREEESLDTYTRNAVQRKIKSLRSGVTFDMRQATKLPETKQADYLDRWYKRAKEEWGWSDKEIFDQMEIHYGEPETKELFKSFLRQQRKKNLENN